MRARFQFTLAVVALAGAALAAQAQYAKVGEIPIGGGSGWDYLTVDSAGKRLYVSHGTEVVVIDLSNDKVVGKIPAGPGVHGIAVAPGLNRAYITNGRGANADGTVGNVSVVDAKTLETLSKVQTAVGHRVFVNIEDKDQIDVIDVDKHEVIGHWPVAPADSPTGLALDGANHRLFAGGGKAVVMIDDKTGKVLASAPICDGTDAAHYDASSKLVFVSCSDGKVTIAHVDSPSKLTVVQTLETAPGSRTMAIDPATHRIYLAAVARQPVDPNAPPPAPAQRGRGPAAVPDSFKVLIFAPK